MPANNAIEMAFYEPGSAWVYDFAYNVDGRLVASGGETLEQIRERKPTIELIPYAEASKRIHDLNTERFSVVKEIDEERFNEMLNVLPPMSWRMSRGVSSFLMCEAVTDTWYMCFMRVDDKYYEGYSDYSAENVDERTDRFMKMIREGKLEVK